MDPLEDRSNSAARVLMPFWPGVSVLGAYKLELTNVRSHEDLIRVLDTLRCADASEIVVHRRSDDGAAG